MAAALAAASAATPTVDGDDARERHPVPKTVRAARATDADDARERRVRPKMRHSDDNDDDDKPVKSVKPAVLSPPAAAPVITEPAPAPTPADIGETAAHPAPRPIGAGGGDDDDDDERQAPATEIVVTSRRLDEARERIEPSLGASTYGIGNDTVEARPGGETGSLVSVLTQFPGTRPDGKGGTVVRGAPGAVQYRLNNVIIPEGAAELGEHLSARLAARIDLTTGALPAQYGLTSGSVVDVTTKSGHYMVGGQVELYGGSGGMFEPAFEWAGGKGATSLFVSGSYRRSDLALPSLDGSIYPAHDHGREYEGMAFADHVIDDASRLSLIFGFSDERKEIPGLAVAAIAGSEGRFGSASNDGQYLVASYLRDSGSLSLQASLFGSLSRSRIDPDEALGVLTDGLARSSFERRRSVGFQVEAAYALSGQNILRAGFVGAIDDSTSSERLVSTAGALDTAGSGSRRPRPTPPAIRRGPSSASVPAA